MLSVTFSLSDDLVSVCIYKKRTRQSYLELVCMVAKSRISLEQVRCSLSLYIV